MGCSGSSSLSTGRLCMRFARKQAGECERAAHDFLSHLGHTQDEEGDQGDGDLDAHCIFADADEALDPQRLLDPAEKQFDLPALLVEVCDLLCRSIEVIINECATPCRYR